MAAVIRCNNCGKPGRRRCCSCVNKGLGTPVAAVPKPQTVEDDETETIAHQQKKKKSGALRIQRIHCHYCRTHDVSPLFLIGYEDVQMGHTACRLCLVKVIEEEIK